MLVMQYGRKLRFTVFEITRFYSQRHISILYVWDDRTEHSINILWKGAVRQRKRNSIDVLSISTHILAAHCRLPIQFYQPMRTSFDRSSLCQFNAFVISLHFECRSTIFTTAVHYSGHIAHVLMWTKQIHYSLRLHWYLMVEMKLSPFYIHLGKRFVYYSVVFLVFFSLLLLSTLCHRKSVVLLAGLRSYDISFGWIEYKLSLTSTLNNNFLFYLCVALIILLRRNT